MGTPVPLEETARKRSRVPSKETVRGRGAENLKWLLPHRGKVARSEEADGKEVEEKEEEKG